MPAERRSRGAPLREIDNEPVGAANGRSRETVAREIDIEPVDRAVAILAGAQHGIITGRQLVGCGLTRHGIAHRVSTGRLHPVFSGTYAVGHRTLAPHARDLAAVLACGPGARLASLTASVLWGLLPDRPGPIHVIRTASSRRAPAGIVLHRGALLAREATVRHGIPVTTPARTLVDLAVVATPRDLERAVNEARVLRLLGPGEPAIVDGARGARALRAVLAHGPTFTRSEAERRLGVLVGKAQLPRPETNVRIGGREVDALWRSQRLVVEVDGYATHSSRAAFERDRRNDASLQAAGFRVLRITWRRLTSEPEAVVAGLAAALAAGGG